MLVRLICLLLAATTLVPIALAQVDPGFPSYEQFFRVNDAEAVNLANLSVVITAPIRSKDGPVPSVSAVNQNNFGFLPLNGTSTQSWAATTNFDPLWTVATNHPRVAAQYLPGWVTCPRGGTADLYIFDGVIDENGTLHPIPTSYWDSKHCLYASNIDQFTTDNTGYELIVPATGTQATFTLYGVDGRSVSGTLDYIDFTTTIGLNTHWAVSSLITVKDTHGSTLTNSTNSTISGSLKDLLAPDPVVEWTQTGQGAQVSYDYGDGVYNKAYLLTVTPEIDTIGPPNNFNAAGGCTNASPAAFQQDLITSIVFPDTSTMQVTYEKNSSGQATGRLSTVKVRTGATYTHNYSGGTNSTGLWCVHVVKTGINGYLTAMATMTINNGTGTWTFAHTLGTGNPGDPGAISYTTVTKPDGSKVAYTFKNDIPTQKIVYDSNGTTVLDTLNWCYDSTISSCNPTASTPSSSPGVVRAYHYVPGVTNPAETDTHYDTHGQIIEIDRNDFGPTPVSTTYVTYGSWNGNACVSLSSIHIYNQPCDIYTVDVAQHVLSQKYFSYDTSTGDLLIKWDNIDGTNYENTFFTYNSNGTLASVTDPDAVKTTFSNNQCNGFLPDSTTNAIGTVSMTWDCAGIVPLSTTDLNGLLTQMTSDDPFWRITKLSDNGGGQATSFTYTSPTQMSTDMVFNGGNSIVDTTTTLDSLGRVLSVQHRQSPTSANYDTITYGYDSTGRRSSTSVACSTPVGGTCSTHASENTFDGLNRVKTHTVKTSTPGVLTFAYSNADVTRTLTPAPSGEHSKIVQTEYDGLGRVVSVCDVVTGGLSGAGICGQRTSGSGYLTKYNLDALGRVSQISRNAQSGATPVNSSFTYDLLSRVTQQSTPESGTSYFYYGTTTSDCAFAGFHGVEGHLNMSKDAAGNELCHSYDNMGRTAYILPVAGPAQLATPQLKFCYDGNCGGSGTNVKGRLNFASTEFGPDYLDSVITEFGYDIYGRTTDVWQTSPSLAGSYFHTTASYFDNGVVNTLGGVPSSQFPTWTYGINGEGRPYSATSGTTHITSSVSYDSASNPLTITYGDGDTDSYQWDPNTNNGTQYQFKLGSAGTTDTGMLTWNPNGTLKTLAITDNITGSNDTQTCSTAHDDLARISSFNCGSVWNESYAYSADYAGNVTKSGNLSFAPGYSASNNHMLAPYTYDSNGYLLHDATLSIDYTWDAFGNILSATGTSISNDAFGHMVEKTASGTTTQYVYTPIGQLGSTSNLTTPKTIKVPLPGGSAFNFNSSNAILERRDPVGSTRLASTYYNRTKSDIFCYGPMGELYCGTAANSQYEGTFQDTNTGLDDFDAAHYSGTQGRSISPTGGANGYVKTNTPF